MKKRFKLPSRLSLILVLMIGTASLNLTSCGDDDVIWDFSPVVLQINIVDADGNNLLLPDEEGSWFGKPMSIEYDGEVYQAQWETPEPPYYSNTRYYLPQFKGLYFDSSHIQGPTLDFGEFDGEKNQKIDATFKIEGYDQEYRIVYTHTVKWKGNNPKVSNSITLNGKSVNEITVTLPKNTSTPTK